MIKKKYQLNRKKKFVDKAQQCFAFFTHQAELAQKFKKDKSKVEISQNFVAFSEYMNFIIQDVLEVLLRFM